MEADIEAGDEYEKGFKLDQVFKVCWRVNQPLPDASQTNLNKPGRTTLKDNVALYLPKQLITAPFVFFITKEIAGIKYTGTNYEPGADFIFPLYDDENTNSSDPRTTNLNPEVVNQLAQKLGLRYTTSLSPEIENENASPVCYANSPEVTEDFKIELPPQTFAPIDILDYIYAVLYSPAYRKKYNELLKENFPEVPYPESQFLFWKLVKSGAELRHIHLLESTGDQ